MKNDLLSSDGIVSFDFFNKKSESLHQHKDIELFYVLEGTVDFIYDAEEYHLSPDDFVLVNPNTAHGHTASANVLYACLRIKYYELSQKTGYMSLLFSCNTAAGNRIEYEELQDLLKKIFKRHKSAEGSNILYLESLYYLLLDKLVAQFAVDLEELDLDGRMSEKLKLRQIENYIQNYYKEPITLERLADYLFFSHSYMSKFFKKHFAIPFSNYLCQVRLEHALEDMHNTSKTITRIAMDNGFPNINAFCKAFKDQYQTTPSQYLEKPDSIPQKADDEDTNIEELSLQVQAYFENKTTGSGTGRTALSKQVNADANTKRHYSKPWNKMINIGRSGELFDLEMNKQLTMMKTELGFEYVRFWDIYAQLNLSEIDLQKNKYNFSKLDRLFDRLLENGLRPFLELGFKPLLLLRFSDGGLNYMVAQQREILFPTPKAYEKFIQAFAAHYCNRYELQEVEKWCFEQWKDPRQLNGTDFSKYFDMFDAAYKGLKSISPHIRIGGGAISFANDNYKEFLNAWYSRSLHPDFFSVYCYPYQNAMAGNVQRSISKQIEALKMVAVEAGFARPEFLLTEWNFTVSDRNPLNDDCFKGAFIIQNALECIGELDVMGYWHASDLLSEYTDTEFILSGGNGLLSKDGIKKPAYHAFSFLNRLDKYLLHKDNECAVTTNGHGNYSIICHNFKRPNLQYYIKTKDTLKINEISDYYENNDKKQFEIKINNVENGSYEIKIYSVSDENGSIHSEWQKMGFSEKMHKDDIEYLKHICVPRIVIRTGEARENVLHVQTTLIPQEIQYIHLTYQS